MNNDIRHRQPSMTSMNVGYASRSFLHKIQCFHTSTSSGIDEPPPASPSPSTSQATEPPMPMTAYLLRVEPPSSSSSTSSKTATLSDDRVEVLVDLEKEIGQSRRMTTTGVSMPIRLLPLSDHGRHYFETSVTDGDDNDRDVNIADDGFPDTEGSSREEEKYEEALEPAIIYLHPIMMQVLATTSSIMPASASASPLSSTAELDRRRNHSHPKRHENHPRMVISVILLPTVVVDSYYSASRMTTHDYTTKTITGTLEIFDIKDINNNNMTYGAANDHTHYNENNDGDMSCHTTIHLEYMCGTTTKARNLFTTHDDVVDNSRRRHPQQLVLLPRGEERDTLIRKQLASMAIIDEGGIIGVDTDEHDADHGDEDGIYDIDFGRNGNVVFFMVNKIVISKGGGGEVSSSDATTIIRTKHLHISKCCSFDVILDPPSFHRQVEVDDTENTVNAVSEAPNDVTSNVRRIMPTPARMFDDNIHFICPGYEPILDELLSLARMMDTPDACPTAVLLSGCSGVGKTRMASWFERELARTSSSSTPSFIKTSIISANDVLLGRSSLSSFDSRRKGKGFHHHSETHEYGWGSGTGPERLLIIDDIDAVIGDADETDTSSIVESEQLRALDAIIRLMDDTINDTSHRCFVLGISRASWAQLPPRLARVGRFEKVVAMLPPTLVQRSTIFEFWLSTLLPHGKEATTADDTAGRWAKLLAPRTAGCVASDIRRICADALTCAAARVQLLLPHTSQSMSEVTVSWEDVKEAARTCVPSQLSSMDVIPATLHEDDWVGGNDHVDDSRIEFELAWKTFGGYDEVKKRLYRTVVRPWKYHIMETESSADNIVDGSVDGILGTSKPSGVLFHGPSGCGKSAAAMCLASSLGLHCVKVRASEVFNQWLGGSEAIIRSIFSRARAASPCILFFDELDALAVNREGGDSDATSGVQSRILTTLLNEMDGITNVGGTQGVLVVAATNRLDAIDAALLRPGRLEEHVLLSYPKSSFIHQILMIQTAKMPIDSSVDLMKLSDILEGSKATCAEIEGVCRDACMIAIRRCSGKDMLHDLSVTTSDFDDAIHRIKRDLS